MCITGFCDVDHTAEVCGGCVACANERCSALRGVLIECMSESSVESEAPNLWGFASVPFLGILLPGCVDCAELIAFD